MLWGLWFACAILVPIRMKKHISMYSRNTHIHTHTHQNPPYRWRSKRNAHVCTNECTAGNEQLKRKHKWKCTARIVKIIALPTNRPSERVSEIVKDPNGTEGRQEETSWRINGNCAKCIQNAHKILQHHWSPGDTHNSHGRHIVEL